MSLRRDACKVNPVNVGLPENSTLNNVKIFNHLTPNMQFYTKCAVLNPYVQFLKLKCAVTKLTKI
jgi:hypothetical protein